MTTILKPLVSIIVPSFNQGRYIAETLRSCIQQDYRPLEVLVMDGLSTDDTAEIVSQFHSPELTWISERDSGVVEAVNKGIARANGDLLTIQSSDDVFLPGAISAVVAKYKANQAAGLFYGDVELINQYSEKIGADILPEFNFREYLGRLQYIPQPGAFFTREAMSSVGGWRESVSYAADADYWMRIANKFTVVKLSRTVAQYRYHPEQRDQQKARILADWTTAVRDIVASGNLSPQERRFANSGIELARYRYAADDEWWLRTRCLYRALRFSPSMLMHPQFPKRELLPGRAPVWSMLSRVKRRLGFKPRMG